MLKKHYNDFQTNPWPSANTARANLPNLSPRVPFTLKAAAGTRPTMRTNRRILPNPLKKTNKASLTSLHRQTPLPAAKKPPPKNLLDFGRTDQANRNSIAEFKLNCWYAARLLHITGKGLSRLFWIPDPLRATPDHLRIPAPLLALLFIKNLKIFASRLFTNRKGWLLFQKKSLS